MKEEPIERPCVVCGVVFKTNRKQRRYCSHICCQRAFLNRQIAGALGVSDKTVGSVRAGMEVSAEIPQIEARTVERNGQTYTVNTANIGQRPPAAAEPPRTLEEWPLASGRMRRGADSLAPVPAWSR